MALYAEILNVRIPRFLQKLFGGKGNPVTRQVSGEVMPVLEIERLPIELRFMNGWRLFGAAVDDLGAAGSLNAIRLRCSANVVAVIEHIITGSSSVAGTYAVTSENFSADLASGLAAGSRDRRFTGAPAAIASSGHPAAVTGGFIYLCSGLPISGNQFGLWEPIKNPNQEIVVAPGTQVTVWLTGPANSRTQMSFAWRERALEETELL